MLILYKKKIKINKKNNNIILKIFNLNDKKKKKKLFFIPTMAISLFIYLFFSLFIEKKLYFYELKLHGLGFKISITKENLLRLDLSWSHALIVKLPSAVFLLKKKKEFILYSTQFFELSNFIFCIKKYYKKNPYHVKGIFEVHEKIKKKLSKQRQ